MRRTADGDGFLHRIRRDRKIGRCGHAGHNRVAFRVGVRLKRIPIAPADFPITPDAVAENVPSAATPHS